MINSDRLRRLFLDLVKINGPSGHERAVADYVKSRLHLLGLEVGEDGVGPEVGSTSGNIIALLRGSATGTPILLNCHMDTVEPTEGLKPVMDGDVIRSDGSTILGADDRAGIAAVIEAVESVAESGVAHADVQLLFTVSEEVGLRGAKAMDRSKIIGRFGYVMDTQKPPGGITVSAPSHETVSVEIHGKAAHAGIAPENGVSAIVAASRAIAGMRLGRIDDETTANVGVIEGGKARNIIPDLVKLKGEARSRNESKLAAQVEHMRSLFNEEASSIGASVSFEHEHEYTGYRWSEKDPVVALACAASRLIGLEPVFQDGGGGSDANVFNSAGIPCVVIGVGYDDAHTHTENVSVEDLTKAAAYTEALIRTAADWKG